MQRYLGLAADLTALFCALEAERPCRVTTPVLDPHAGQEISLDFAMQPPPTERRDSMGFEII
jgi:hypothetical protein